MKLCQKCASAIAEKLGIPVRTAPAIHRYFVFGGQNAINYIEVATESECEFYLHKLFNSVIELVKWCTVCGKPTNSNTVKCECGAEHQWSGLPFWR